jgi:hypothetical protein
MIFGLAVKIYLARFNIKFFTGLDADESYTRGFFFSDRMLWRIFKGSVSWDDYLPEF